MKLVFAGTPELAIPSLAAILSAGHEVVGVITRPDARQGRGRKLTASPVADYATQQGLPVYKPASATSPEFSELLDELAPDLCVVVAYGALLPQAVLDQVPQGWINLHFSLLPKWRGAAPLQRSLMNGDAQGGVTIFQIVAELDAGPIYLQKTYDYGENETAGEAFAALAELGAEALIEAIDLIAAHHQPEPQDDMQATLAPKLNPTQLRIDWTAPAHEIHNLVRGASPNPGAWTMVADKRLKVIATKISAESLPPGELKAEKRRVLVGAGTQALELVRVQPPGKKPMPGADWARGGISSGQVCE